MTETALAELPAQNGRTATGQFAVGNSGGPGNTSDRINIARLCRLKCEEYGLDLDDLAWDIMLAMALKGACGDVKAAGLFLDRVAGGIDRGPLIAIDATQTGPPIPRLAELGEHLAKLNAIAQSRGVVIGEEIKPAVLIDALAKHKAAEAAAELLS